MDPRHYTYRVNWSEEDREFVATVAEFPSLSWLDESQENALRGLVRLVMSVVQDMRSNGEIIPTPIGQRNFSGNISLRTTPDIHRRLVLEAAERGISLNRYVNSLLIG